ncbi:hypothetical protein HY571_02650 [Candidatus Micrarchaeota archaeon]|nr:hypothetical protein [Candidatus Micrarchaeota archaeon]
MRETSFDAAQLQDGVKTCEKAVKAFHSTCKSLGLGPSECLAKSAPRARATRALRRKVPRLSPRQAKFLVDNLEAFQTAVALNAEPVGGAKAAKKASEYVDRYYQPVQHNYR